MHITYYTPHTYHHPCFNNSKCFMKSQTTKLLNMQISPAACYLLPVLPHVSLSTRFCSTLLSTVWKTEFYAHTKQWVNTYIFILLLSHFKAADGIWMHCELSCSKNYPKVIYSQWSWCNPYFLALFPDMASSSSLYMCVCVCVDHPVCQLSVHKHKMLMNKFKAGGNLI